MRQLALLLLLTVITAGCGSLFAQAQDDLSSWGAVPLPADRKLAAKAAEGCKPIDEAFAVQIVLQDQRTPATAAFLLAAPGWTGSCMFSANGGGASSDWTSGPLPAFADAIVVDEQSVGEIGNGTATLHGGRAAAGVVRVEIDLADGKTVAASVGNGHWLAWWTGGVLADSITATSADGTVQVLAWGPDGWTPR